jgi:hypothetical protein
MKKIVERLVEKMKYSDKDSILLDSPDARHFDIDKGKFTELPQTVTGRKIAFVDGGNLEVFASPSLSLFFNRVYYTIYRHNKREKSKLIEFFTLISSEDSEGRIFFRTEYFFTKDSIALKEYSFDSFDKTMAVGNKRAAISQVGNIIRRFSELSIVNDIDADYVMLDGTLEAQYTYEKGLIDSIRRPVFGLAKTSTLLTGKGNSAAAYLASIADKNPWYYPLGRSDAAGHDAFVYFIKLNRHSDYVFRFEAKDNKDVDAVISLLAQNSKDPVFFGYPYGLVEADRFARVSNIEKASLGLQLDVLLGKDIKKIKSLANSINAHSVLDRMG